MDSGLTFVPEFLMRKIDKAAVIGFAILPKNLENVLNNFRRIIVKIVEIKALTGPNVFSHHPVLWCKVDLGKFTDVSSCQIDGFNERLLEFLPNLNDHQCALGEKGGFVKRLYEGTYLAHIFEHIVLELQNECGDDVSYGKARVTKQDNIYDVIVAFYYESVARRCAKIGEELLNAVIFKQPYDLKTKLLKVQKVWQAVQLGPSAQTIYQAAKQRNIPVQRFFEEDLLELGQGIHRQKVWSTVTEKTSLVAADLVSNKYLTTQLLSRHNVPVPRNEIVEREEEAVKAFHHFGGKVVVKPLTGSHGRGVTVEVENEKDIREAFRIAAAYDEYVLIEEYIVGRQYRICVVDGKMVAASERIPAYVIGDGKHTVEELVRIINSNPLRGDGHDKPLSKIVIDDVALAVLEKQKLTPHLVPEAKRVVQIRATANLSTGGTAVDVTKGVHEETAKLAEYAAQIVGLDIAGFDIIAKDITKPLVSGNGAFIEVNAAPGIRMHHYPSAGQPQDVGGAIVEYLYPYEQTGRIPITAITGTNGKTTVTRMLSSIYQQAGFAVGMSNTEGIFLNNECMFKGDCSGPDSAKMILANKKVSAAVLETARGGIVRAGLGFDRCDVGIITNISEDHLGQDGIESLEDLAYIKSLILEMVDKNGAAIINADDTFAEYFTSRVCAPIVYTSIQAENKWIKRHLGIGGKCVFIKDDKIYAAHGDKMKELVAISDIPVTMYGKALHNVQNALIAAAAAHAYGINDQYIRKGLRNFAQNNGRLMVIQIRDFSVCVDYGHNMDGYKALIATARKLGKGRIIGVIAAPGDRQDNSIVELGRVAGLGFDEIYIKEDSDLRGRNRGETAELLKKGVIAAGVAAEKIKVILDERQAVELALNHAQKDDFIVVFYELYDVVMRTVMQMKKRFEEEKESKIEGKYEVLAIEKEKHNVKRRTI